MPSFVATISRTTPENWATCKRLGIWGTPRGNVAESAARQAQPGDTIFFWQGGEGFIAVGEITHAAEEFGPEDEVPWPGGHSKYESRIRFQLMRELEKPIPDDFRANFSARFGLAKPTLHAGFAVLTHEQETAIRSAFESEIRPTTESGRPHPVGAVFLRPSSGVADAMLRLYQMGDDEAELYVVGAADQRAAFERELAEEPLCGFGARFRFVTPDELASELRAEP